MPEILLGVTGSVAAIKTPDLYHELKRAGHTVKVVATRASLYFFDPAALDPLDPAQPRRNPEVVVLDEDEWPGRDQGRRYQRQDDVLHIELRRWARLLLVAPLDANTLAKLAAGLADNCLTCVYRAWDLTRPVVLAPAMNTLMWEHPLTARHLRQLATDQGAPPPDNLQLPEELIEWINARCPLLQVVSPESRRLACGDVGVGALAGLERIVTVVNEMLARVDSSRPQSEELETGY
jgi:phosphopantothenoylcysteine decarboxylase